MSTPPRFITAAEIHKRCSNLRTQVDLQAAVFKRFAKGEALMGLRVLIPGSMNPDNSANFSYIARSKAVGGRTVVKFGSFVPENKSKNIPVVNAYIGVMHAETGQLEALIDGEEVTTMRTAAASFVAAEAFLRRRGRSNDHVCKIEIVGSGVQGQSHARFAKEIFPKATIDICSRSDILEKCASADITFLCTNASESIFPAGYKFKQGSAVISVGSFAPNRAEVDAKVMEGSISDESKNSPCFVVGDDCETCFKQCGAIRSLSDETKKGVVSLGSLLVSLDEHDENVVVKKNNNDNGVDFYFSVGLGIQDAVVGEFLLEE